LEKIAASEYTRIVKRLQELANDPRPNGYKKLKGRGGYRIRIGDYRIIYEIEDNKLVVLVIDIGHRKDIYN
jgi:mRNA interferase RelE/StbE